MTVASAIVAFLAGFPDEAAKLWARFIGWARDSAYPWLQKTLPSLAEDFMLCLSFLDGVVVTGIRIVRAAWAHVKEALLSLAVELERMSDWVWVRRATGYWIDALNHDRVVRTIETKEVAHDELPPDIREAILRRGTTKFTTRIDDELNLQLN